MSIHYPKQGSESLKACGKGSCLLKPALGPNVRPLSLTLLAFAPSTGKMKNENWCKSQKSLKKDKK